MLPLDSLLVIDIETVSQSPDWTSMDDYWKQLWEQKIEKQLPDGENPESFYPKRAATSLNSGKSFVLVRVIFVCRMEKLFSG